MAVPSQFNNRLGPLGAFGGEFDTFTGLAEETILGNAISVNYKSDQNTFLTLQQAPDGVNWYIQDQKLLVANEEHIFQHPAVLPFFRVIIQNRGLVDQTFGDLITSLVQIQTNNIGVVATIGDISPSKDGVLTYGLSGASPLAMRVDASGSLITTSTATGASAASVTAWGKDSLGASYPLPLTTGGAEIAMSITDPLPAGTAHIGEVSISNLPSVQEVSGTVTVASITDPLPQGTNTLGAVRTEGQYNDGTTISLVQNSMFLFEPSQAPAQGYVGSGLIGASVVTMDAFYGGASAGVCAIDDAWADGQGGPRPAAMSYLSSRYIPPVLTAPTTNPINSLHTWVDNHPAVQDISGTVTVASITAPLPSGTNTIGGVKIVGTNDRGIDVLTLNPTVFQFNPGGGSVGTNAIGLVTTSDAQYGNASTAMCARDDGTGTGIEIDFLSFRKTGDVGSSPINALHTWVDNQPAVQDISGTVTVASITEPVVVASIAGALPGGSNIIGATYMLAIDDGAGGGDEVYLSSKVTGIDPVSQYTIHALHTYVDNQPAVQVVGGRETDYMFYATPATNVAAVYADGIQGVNVTGGWSYTSTQVGVAPFTGSRNKINWYLYGSTDASTDFTVSQLSNVYAVINQKSTLGMASELPFITIYTRPDSGTNVGGWYKNKLTYDTLTNSLYDGTTGMKLLYTGADPVGIHPEITGLNRVKLNFDPIFSTVASESLAYGEGVWLGTLQTNSAAAPDGTRNFVFSEFSMMWDQSAIPLPISQNQVQVFDKALNASAATLVTDLSGITITANKLQVGGTVAVSNFPATQPVSGSVSVSNLPATQPVSGSVSVSNLPATQPVSGTFWQATQPVSGTFWQATQPVSGTVAISNFPEGGSNVTIVSPLPAGTNAIGSVTVSNFPAGGSEVSVTNFPATQPISGTVAISNFPEGGSEVSVVSALPTGANVIGAVNINSSFYTAQNYSLFDVTYGDGVSVAHYIPQYKSVDLMLSVNQVNNPDTQDGMTLNIQVSNDGQTFGTIPNYSMNFKGQNPATLAINNIETNAIWVRAVALKDKNPSSMSMYAIFTIMAKY